jgi:neutral trehalase
MVKDYKRLQGDDSDDAYSDYVSEAEENSENTVAVNLLPGKYHVPVFIFNNCLLWDKFFFFI